MIAGTIALLDTPAEEPLTDTATAGGRPALQVEKTQRDLDGDAIAQAGTAVGTVPTTDQDISVLQDDGDVTIITEEMEARDEHLTDWVGDVTGRGVLVVESLAGADALTFPLDFFAARLDRRPTRVEIALQDLVVDWGEEFDTWYVGNSEGDDRAQLAYHNAATRPQDATVGLGFERAWQHTVARGVIYESGYIAIYSPWTHSVFLKFLDEEILPFARAVDSGVQSELGGDN